MRPAAGPSLARTKTASCCNTGGLADSGVLMTLLGLALTGAMHGVAAMLLWNSAEVAKRLDLEASGRMEVSRATARELDSIDRSLAQPVPGSGCRPGGRARQARRLRVGRGRP